MKSVSLGNLEQEIMEVVWGKKGCLIKDVQTELKRKSHSLAYTTVATILQRLYAKGLVKRTAEGKSYHYHSKISKTSFSKTMARSFISRFVRSFGDVAIASFADSIDTLPKEKKAYFLKLLKQYEAK